MGSHYKRIAQSSSELSVSGDLAELFLVGIEPRAVIQDDFRGTGKEFTIVEIIVMNQSRLRMRLYYPEPILVDSDGFQHQGFHLLMSASITTAIYLPTGNSVSGLPNYLEPQSKARGWIAFPALNSAAYPHRLIFRATAISRHPTKGEIGDTETLELIMDLPGTCLPQGRENN